MHSTDVPIAPIPIPDGEHCALVYGGSFDPPHRAHLTLPLRVRDAIGADLALYIPAGRSPFKEANPIATGPQRVEMLRAGLEGRPRVAIATLELTGDDDADGNTADDDGPAPPSYTVDTLERLKRARPGAALRLLIGADQARSFHRWREAARIIALAPPVVMLRPGQTSAEGLIDELRAHWDDDAVAHWRSALAPIDEEIDASSTQIRALLASDPADPRLGDMLTPPVRTVIDAHRLYRAGGTGATPV